MCSSDLLGPCSSGSWLGLVPSREQSGESDRHGAITKTGSKYARRILVNLALDAAGGRTRRRSELDGAPAVADGPARDLLVGFETRAELLDALARLTPRQRAVLVLRYFNDLTEAQTAEVLGCSPGTVKSNASRGLARLRIQRGEGRSIPRRLGASRQNFGGAGQHSTKRL